MLSLLIKSKTGERTVYPFIGNWLGTTKAVFLSGALKVNTSLTELDLSSYKAC